MTQSSSAASRELPGRATINDEWRKWPLGATCWTPLDEDKASRPYQHWRLAAELNTPDADDVRRGTVVQKLWNAVDVRVKTLHDAYSLSQIRTLLRLDRRTSTLDVLERLGLVRPLILRRLKDIRNTVEHQDSGAPVTHECDTLIDAVWYFLRSTDSYAMQRLDYFELIAGLDLSAQRRHGPSISFDIALTEWTVKVHGWFRSRDILRSGATSTAGLVLQLDETPHVGDDDAVYLSGTADPDSDLMPLVLETCFALNSPSGAIFRL
jgi:hypothetical protein